MGLQVAAGPELVEVGSEKNRLVEVGSEKNRLVEVGSEKNRFEKLLENPLTVDR